MTAQAHESPGECARNKWKERQFVSCVLGLVMRCASTILPTATSSNMPNSDFALSGQSLRNDGHIMNY